MRYNGRLDISEDCAYRDFLLTLPRLIKEEATVALTCEHVMWWASHDGRRQKEWMVCRVID